MPKAKKTLKRPTANGTDNPRNTRNACWCYTHNNYTEAEEAFYRSFHLTCKQVLYHVFGEEIGKNGTPHLQGYIVFTNTKMMSTVKNLLPGNPHLAVALGSNKEASDYCKKGDQTKTEWKQFGCTHPNWGKNSMVFEHGELPKDKSPGKRNDLDEVKAMLDDGATLADVAREHFTPFVKFHRGFTKYQSLTTERRNHKTQVMVITGTPRTFKSYALNRIQHGYHVVRPTTSNAGCWYDGYDSNEHNAVIFDDFGGSWMPYHNLLELTDRYACLVQTKGGTVQYRPYVMGFSSNYPADAWYPSMEFPALDGRIDLHFTHVRCEAPDNAKGLVNGDIVITCLKGSPRHHPLFEWLTACGCDELSHPQYKLGLDFQRDMAEAQMSEEVKDDFWAAVYKESSDDVELSDEPEMKYEIISSDEEMPGSSDIDDSYVGEDIQDFME